MSGLFELEGRRALLSPDGVYRYTLHRGWGARGSASAVFVMLNPSTADAHLDDPTIRRCVGFAKRLGCGGLKVVNLYAYRATSPDDMFAARRAGNDIIGPENDEILWATLYVAAHHDRPVVAAWGAEADQARVAEVVSMARAAGVEFQALGVTKHGAPRHPLYLRADSELTPWEHPNG